MEGLSAKQKKKQSQLVFSNCFFKPNPGSHYSCTLCVLKKSTHAPLCYSDLFCSVTMGCIADLGPHL